MLLTKFSLDVVAKKQFCHPLGSHSARDVSHAANDDDDENDDVSKVIEDLREVIRRPIGRFEAIPDDMSPQEILDQVGFSSRNSKVRSIVAVKQNTFS